MIIGVVKHFQSKKIPAVPSMGKHIVVASNGSIKNKLKSKPRAVSVRGSAR